jgi:HlyD family secretion protein
MNGKIFRKVSLDRLASPEQLDQLMQITNPRGWIALAAFGALLATCIAWGIFGSVPDKIAGQGILIRTGGVFEVTTLSSGQVVDMAVRVGEEVDHGQVIARIAQPEIVRRVQAAKADLDAVAAEFERTRSFAARDERLRTESLSEREQSLTEGIRAIRQSIQWLEEKGAGQEALVREGLITRQTLMNTRTELENAREKIRMQEGELRRAAVDRLAIRNQLQKDVESSRFQMEQKRTALAEAEAELENSSKITSPYTGRVLEVMAEQGSVIGRGESILSLDLTGKAVKELEAVMYVAATHGKKIEPGMQIQITPATVRKEEYGMMMGRVTYVSDFPATTRGMSRVLKNDQLVATLSGGGAPYEVRADLLPDPTTPSRYRWSSSEGPPAEVRSGTLAGASITVHSKRPIALVLPILRRAAGI